MSLTASSSSAAFFVKMIRSNFPRLGRFAARPAKIEWPIAFNECEPISRLTAVLAGVLSRPFLHLVFLLS